jgi:hypothetical protein
MNKMPWLKLYTEIRTDPKMQALSDAEFRAWINLMCLAAESKVRGEICIDQEIPYPEDALAKAIHVTRATLKKYLIKFSRLRMIEIRNEIVVLMNFQARQYNKPSDKPEAVAERVRRHRAAKTREDSADNETPLKRQCNAGDLELDLDRDIDQDQEIVKDRPGDEAPPGESPGKDPPKKIAPLGIEELRAKYSPEQLGTIDDYWTAIRRTRQGGSLAESVIRRTMDKWAAYSAPIVIQGLKTHLSRYPSKREDYTIGIIRRLRQERNGGAENGRGTPNRHYDSQDARTRLDEVDFDQFVYKG